jgi:hypothetical protein
MMKPDSRLSVGAALHRNDIGRRWVAVRSSDHSGAYLGSVGVDYLTKGVGGKVAVTRGGLRLCVAEQLPRLAAGPRLSTFRLINLSVGISGHGVIEVRMRGEHERVSSVASTSTPVGAARGALSTRHGSPCGCCAWPSGPQSSEPDEVFKARLPDIRS